MERYSRKEEACPKLLDLIPKEREWLMKRAEEAARHGTSEEKKLELRLGPPGGDWNFGENKSSNNNKNSRDIDHESHLPFGYLSNNMSQNANSNSCGKTHVLPSPWAKQAKAPAFLHLQSIQQQPHNKLPVIAKDSPQLCHSRPGVELQNAEKKAFSPAPPAKPHNSSAQKRTAPAPVVGWPPIRSFRKNLASGSSSSKPVSELQNAPDKAPSDTPTENCSKNLFVKINMDGVPIGRKVDLKAFDGYEKLSSAVDELFRGLLAAQNDSSGNGKPNKEGSGGKAITGLLDGSGEYTLVYEDNEGDRMLVGDVPWQLFISTVKRLRVLKSSELTTLRRGSKQG